MLSGKGIERTALIAFVFLSVLVTFILVGGGYAGHWYDARAEQIKAYSNRWSSEGVTVSPTSGKNISYDLSRPPSTGCEEVVSKIQLRLIESYSEMLRGVRYANIWGYLETENKGDAAIWTAQQMLLAQLGITSEYSCRHMDKDCDFYHFNKSLVTHAPYSAIIMAGGGNFNDYYWEDQPSRLNMARTFPDVPIRAFPQSVYMTHADKIAETQDAFGKHPDLMLAARDRPSWEWLDQNLEKAVGVPSALVPDIAFMWGNRPDFRLNTKKAYDIIILARKDMEISAGNTKNIPYGEGFFDLGGSVGNVSYLKVDWKFTHTPGIDGGLPFYLWNSQQEVASPAPDLTRTMAANATLEDRKWQKHDYGTQAQRERASELMYEEFAPKAEKGKNARAWAKAQAGFQMLGSARFVITDRLHGHIMSTVIGTPHVLMDSKLGKNINFHDTWTRDCGCVRITDNFKGALGVAKLWFERNGRS